MLRSLILTICLLFLRSGFAQSTFIRNLTLPGEITLLDVDIAPDGDLWMCGRVSEVEGLQGFLARLDAEGNVVFARTYTAKRSLYPYIAPFADVSMNSISASDTGAYVVGTAGFGETFYQSGPTYALFDQGGVPLDAAFAGMELNSRRPLMEMYESDELRCEHYSSPVTGSRVTFYRVDRTNSTVSTSGFYRASTSGFNASARLGDVVLTNDGGSLGSVSKAFPDIGTAMVVKFDASMFEQWRFPFSIEGVNDLSCHIGSAPDNSVRMCMEGTYTGAPIDPFVIAELSADGSLQWSRMVSMAGNLSANDMLVDANGNMIVSGSGVSADSPEDKFAWLMQFDPNGDLEWARRFGDVTTPCSAQFLRPANDGSGYYLIGTDGLRVTVLRVGAAGEMVMCPNSDIPVSNLAITLSPNDQWYDPEPGASIQWGGDLLYSNHGDNYASQQCFYAQAATYLSTNLECGGAQTGFSAQGSSFLDSNENGTFDPGEPPFAWSLVDVTPDEGSLFNDSDGSYTLFTTVEGTYTVSQNTPSQWWTPTTSQIHQVTLSASTPDIQGLDFGFTSLFDTTVVSGSIASGPFRCLGSTQQRISLLNQGTTTPSGTVTLEMEPWLTMVQADPEPDSLVNNIAYWHYGPIGPYQFWYIDLVLEQEEGTVPQDSVHHVLTVHEEGVIAPLDVHEQHANVLCSFDPNDKHVAEGYGPAGSIELGTEWLTYTIRFQNTGTDTAYTVVIEDLLSEDLQWNTVQILGTSHTLTSAAVNVAGKATFRFEDIHLPDSTTNGPESNGHIQFRIRLVEGLTVGTVIKNNAGIFFDLNEPVITEFTTNTIVNCVPAPWQPSVYYFTSGDYLYAGTTPEQGSLWSATYEWFLDGEPIDDFDLIFFPAEGTYTVIVYGSDGCVATSDPYVHLITGVDDPTAHALSVSPNPFTESTEVRSKEVLGADTKFELTDPLGRLVRAWKGPGGRIIHVERGELRPGVYFLRILSTGTQAEAVRLVVE